MSATRDSKVWSALYDYKKMVGYGFFTRNSRKEFIKKIEEEQKKMNPNEIKLLRNFTIQLKASTSFWYGGFLFSLFRSQRKEMAFNIIISALDKSLTATNFFGDEEISANSAKILLYVLHNAMVNRGSGSQTSSGLKAIELLEDEKFSDLKKFLPNYINYAQLKKLQRNMMKKNKIG